MFSCITNRNGHKFLLLDVRKWIFLIGKKTHRYALVPYSTTGAQVDTTSGITNLANHVSVSILHAVHHAVVPIFNIFLPYLKAFDGSVPGNLYE